MNDPILDPEPEKVFEVAVDEPIAEPVAEEQTELQRELAAAASRERAARVPPISLNEYLGLVERNPTIAATAHQRIYNMIMAKGAEPGAQPEETSFKFFADDLFGMDVPLERLVRYFDSAAQGHETRRRILLLWGPPGGAKSSVVALLKRGLETYTRTDEGAVYAIDGCPMHEDPLHLVPRDMRSRVSESIGVDIEGTLCPVCAHRLEEEFNGDFLRFPVRRIFLDEATRVGIGTFEPADPKSQSMEHLTGGLDYAKIAQYGSEAHPLALDWAGEFSKSNRGLFEAVEFLKLEKEFRNGFLSAAQEKQFKVPKFGYVGLDTAIVSHSNEAEYRKFMADPTNEALRDRLFIVQVPYNTRITDETAIYTKLLTRGTRRFHISPHTLETAGTLAVLSRLKPHEGIELMAKAKLYDGEETGEWRLAQIPELKRAAEYEGMTGIGPRAVINALSAAAVAQERKGASEPYLTPIIALMAMLEHIEHLDAATADRELLKKFVVDARTELDRELKDEVRRAFVPAFAEQAQNVLENYLLNVEAHLNANKVRDPITKELVEPDEKLMRAIEEKVSPSVPESAKDTFRQGVFMRIGMATRKGRPLNYETDQQLGRSIEEYLFDEMSDVIRITVSKRNPDPEQVKRMNEVVRVLVEERGYSDESAADVTEYVGQLLNR
jgi:serine protein kinase